MNEKSYLFKAVIASEERAKQSICLGQIATLVPRSQRREKYKLHSLTRVKSVRICLISSICVPIIHSIFPKIFQLEVLTFLIRF